MTTVESARKYDDLLSGAVASGPYDYEALFKSDGFHARQRAKRRFKLLKAIDLKLRHILDPGEKVLFLTPGTIVSKGERIWIGWLSNYLNRQALVFTSRRILLLQIDLRQRPLEVVSQLPYASITSVKATGNGDCALRLLNRESYYLQHIAAADQKVVAEFLAGLVQLTNAPFEHKRAIELLCPHCFNFIPGHPAACPACTGKIKSAWKAGLLSWFLPGLGGWYLGQRSIALLEMLGTGALWYFLVISPLLDGAAAPSISTHSPYWFTVGGILLLTHTIDGLITTYFSRKGHYSAGEAPLLAGSLPPFMDRPKPDLNLYNKLKINRTNPTTPIEGS